VELLSEEEQWEALKRWMRTNLSSIAAMVALLLAGFYGWQLWQQRADTQALAANASYEKILRTFDENKVDEAVAQLEALRMAHPKSAYVAAADLAAARVFVSRNELDKAAQALQRVMNDSVDVQLRPIARLRLARVQSAQGQYDLALATLQAGNAVAHLAAYTEARGDILLTKGDRSGALKEYEAARKLVPQNEQGLADVGQLLDLKINDLLATEATPVTTPTPSATATKP
jgi:predicted negative regulator of RcsB-dependent stress response